MKRETMKYRLDNHLCTRCGRPAMQNRKMCAEHLEQSRIKEKNKREKRKAASVCIRCGQRPPRSGKTQCEICANSNKDQYNAAKMDVYYQRRSAGQCVRCGTQTDQFEVHCSSCVEYMRTKNNNTYHSRKNSGLCAHCGKEPPILHETLCQSCKQKNAHRCMDNRKKQKFTIIQHYGGKCALCGESDIDVLAIDHIAGGGTQHNKQLREQGTTLHRWLIKNDFPDGFQVLCFNCNMKKHLAGDN